MEASRSKPSIEPPAPVEPDVREQVALRSRARCPFCHDDIEAEVKKWGCPDCMAWHHRECRDDHGRCAACGHAEDGRSPAAPPIGAELASCRLCHEPVVVDPESGESTIELCREHARSKASSLAVMRLLLLTFQLLFFGVGAAATLDGESFGPGLIAVGFAWMLLAQFVSHRRKTLTRVLERQSLVRLGSEIAESRKPGGVSAASKDEPGEARATP